MPGTTTYECQCKAGYTVAGVGCITPDEETALKGRLAGGNLGAAFDLTYRNLIGATKQDSITSNTLSYFFVQAAVGCWKHKTPESC